MKKPPATSPRRITTAGSSPTNRSGKNTGNAPDLSCPSRRLCRRVMAHEQWDARLRLVVQGDVNRVKPGIIELQLLKVHDEVARAEMHVFGQRHFDRDVWEFGDRGPVPIDEIKLQVVLALVSVKEGDSQRDGALGVYGWKVLRIDRVKRPQQVQLAVVIGRCVAQNRHLYIPPAAIKTRIAQIGTHLFGPGYARDHAGRVRVSDLGFRISGLSCRASRNALSSAAALPPKPGTSAIFSTLASRMRWTEPNFRSNAALRRSPMLGNSSSRLSEIFRSRSWAL